MYTAFVLSEESRNHLTEAFPPLFDDHIGHHITVAFGVPKGTEAPEQPSHVLVTGYVCDDEGIEAFVVSVDGNARRPDEKFFHITWSLDRSKFSQKDSNELILREIVHLLVPIPIKVVPAVLK